MDLTFLALQTERLTSAVLPGGDQKTLLVLGVVYLVMILAGMILAFNFFDRLRTGHFDWDERLARLKNRPWHWKEAGFLALLLGTVQMIVMWLVMVASHVKTVLSSVMKEIDIRAGWLGVEAPDWFFVMIQILFFHVLGLAAIAIMVRRKPGVLAAAFGFGLPGIYGQIRTGAVFYLASLPFVLFGAIVYHLVLYRFGVQTDTQDVIGIFMTAPSGIRVALLFSAIVIAPVFEEALFRGIALPLFIRRFGGAAGIVMVSAVFAGFHFHLTSFLPLFILAVSFSLAYVYTGSLVVPAVMHALFNGVNLGLVVLLSSGGN